MLTNETAIARITRQINVSEGALADALVEYSALVHSIAVAARDLPDAPLLETQAVLLRSHKAIGNLVELRGETVRIHGQLKDIGRVLNAGEEPWCPPKTAALEKPVQEVAQLKLA